MDEDTKIVKHGYFFKDMAMIAGKYIMVWQIIAAFRGGIPTSSLADVLSLKNEDIIEALRYYMENKEEIDGNIQEFF